MNELPKGWASARLDELVTLNPKQNSDDELTAGFVPMSHAPTNFRDKLRFDERNWGEIKKAYTNFKDRDVIFAKVTPCFENGKAALVEGLPNGIGAGSSEFYVLRPGTEAVSAKYLLALVKSREFMREGAANMTGAVGLRRVPKKFVEDFVVPVPPAAEQTRIAQKLDELLAQVDTLKARIDTIPTLLKRLRLSVLAAAVSGRLTEEWRHNRGTPSPEKKSIGEMTELVTKGASPRWQGVNYVEDRTQTLFVTSENVRSMYLDITKEKYIEDKFNSLQPRSILVDGDILTNIVGASIGRAAVWRLSRKANVNQAVCIIRPQPDKLNSDYLCLYLNSPEGIAALAGEAVDVARANVSLAAIKGIHISAPDVPEQTEIVRRVELLFAFADQLEAKIASAKTRIDHLTQSILAKAFRGELLPQNPNDEPASILLARIKAERAVAPKANRARKVSTSAAG